MSIEVDIADDYVCDTDCWWTIKYDFGSGSLPTDRTVWSPILIDKPAASATTTSTVVETTTTTTMPIPLGSPRNQPLPEGPSA